MSTTNISLDFYNNTIVSINAKQEDANSRSIIATFTEHGKKVMLDSSYMSAFIRMRKSDGTLIYEEASISPEGQVIFTLTSQMLASTGKQVTDLMILSNTKLTKTDFEQIEDINDLSNTSVISVMPFYLLVTASAIDSEEIISTNEFNALIKQTTRLQQLESKVNVKEAKREENEMERIKAEDLRQNGEFGETYRQTQEQIRQNQETERQNGEFGESYRQAQEKIRQDDQTGEAYRIKNEMERSSTFDGWVKTIDEKITVINASTEAANKAVSDFNSLVDKSGVVMQEEKGAASGVATLDENKYVPAEQLANVHSIIPHIYHDTADPNTLEAFGNDNDIYMMVIDG